MTTPPPGPPPGPPPYGPPPRDRPSASKPPPSWWWFVGPVTLLVLSGVVFAVMLGTTINEVSQIDARVPADGTAHRVTVPTDGDRMLFADSSGDRAPCVVADSEGRVIEQRDVVGNFSMQRDGQDWSGLTRFDPGDGEIEVRCPRDPLSPEGEVLVTPAHDVSNFVVRVMVTILGPMILGGIALLWAIILAIVILTRRAAQRDRTS